MGAVHSVALRKAVRVYAKNVDRREVARVYLKGEFGRVFPSNARPVVNAVDDMVDQLDDAELWRMLEAMSHTFRLNSVYFDVTDNGLDWHEVELPISAIRMSGIDPIVNKVLSSREIGLDPVRFAAWLRANPDVEPNFDEFRPRKGGVRHPMITVAETGDYLKIRDGSHRLIAYALEGHKTVRAFTSVPNGKTSSLDRWRCDLHSTTRNLLVSSAWQSRSRDSP